MDERKEHAVKVCSILQSEQYIAVLAGGCVRDELLGREPKDYDVATSATPEEVIAAMKKNSITCFPKGKAFGVMAAVFGHDVVEIATLRGDGAYSDGRRPDNVVFVRDLKADASRRDFTINAMYRDPISGRLYDFFNGQKDLSHEIISCIGSATDRFEEDRLRIMRAFRFQAQLGFVLEYRTSEALKEVALVGISWERIAEELRKMLGAPWPIIGLSSMFSYGVAFQVIPELDAMTRGEQSRQDPIWHPEGSVMIHTFRVLGLLQAGLAWEGRDSWERMFAGLLHDVGKPATQEVRDDGHITNRQHEFVGAEMARTICHRLRFSGDETRRIVTIIENHMRMHHIHELGKAKLHRMLENPYIEDMIALQHADAMGTGRPPADREERSKREWIAAKRAEIAAEPEHRRLGAPPLVTGDDLVAVGWKPGEQFKPALAAAREAQAEGLFETKEAGLAWVLERF